MDASVDSNSPFGAAGPGRFTRVSVQTIAGEIEAKLSKAGNWELRVRQDQETCWRMACRGDLNCGAITAHPVAQEPLVRGALTVDPASRRASVGVFGVARAVSALPPAVVMGRDAKIWEGGGSRAASIL
jgi:hypothetical protein